MASRCIDGVQQTVNAVRRGTRNFFDLEQLEVCRSPQSTLSGRAALAGTMYMRTKDPEFAPSGDLILSYGSDNHRRADVAFGDVLGRICPSMAPGDNHTCAVELAWESIGQHPHHVATAT